MRIGLMIGPERGRYREKVDRLVEAGVGAEKAGFTAIWVPQIPGEFDAFTMISLLGRATESIELGTAVLPVQTRHPVAMAQEALSCQAICEGRLTIGLGPSHHWIIDDMLGLPYERPAQLMKCYLEVLNACFAGPGTVELENELYRVNSPMDVTDIDPPSILTAALGPVMLRIAGELTDGTILWMADERAIADHVVPRITSAAEGAGRPAPRVVAGVPVCLCDPSEIDEARVWANRLLGHAEYSPNYERLLERGDAKDVGDMLAAGDEATIVERLERFRDAGATDLAVRVLAIGPDRESRIASKKRTEAFLSTLCPEL